MQDVGLQQEPTPVISTITTRGKAQCACTSIRSISLHESSCPSLAGQLNAHVDARVNVWTMPEVNQALAEDPPHTA